MLYSMAYENEGTVTKIDRINVKILIVIAPY